MLSSAMLTAPRMAQRHLSSMAGRNSLFSRSLLAKQRSVSHPRTKVVLRPSSTLPKVPTASSSTPKDIPPILFPAVQRPTKKQLISYGIIGALTAQSFFGSCSDFYEYRFIVNEDIDPDDLASFYGSDCFMELFCIFPFVQELMMRGGYFDDEGTVHAYGFPGELLVSMAFTDGEDDDGGQWFNKRERFKDVLWGNKMWDQVSNFGFHTLENGKIEVYHNGEYFVGRLPLVSLAVKIVFQVHARWVAWATEHHLNHAAFKEGDEEEEIEELSRSNHMLYMVKHHFWKDFKAMVGFKDSANDSPSQASFLSFDEEENVKKVLPIKHKATLRIIHDSIEEDKELDLAQTGLLDSMSSDNAYQMAQKLALQRHETLRLKKRKTMLVNMKQGGI